MNQMFKISLVLTVLCFFPAWAFATSSAQAGKLVHDRASQLVQSVGSVHTVWERCDVKKYRNRSRLRGFGRRYPKDITLSANCKDVQTRCSAIVKDSILFVPSSCFYAQKDEDQKLTMKTAKLSWNGRSLVKSAVSGSVSDFVYFALK